jgi:hypothetical protein
MGVLLALLVAWGFWVVVAVTIILLVRWAAQSHDDEERVCELDDAYYASRREQTGAHAT